MFRRRAGSDETESKRSRPLGSAPPTAREEPNVFLSRLYVNRILRRGRNRLGILPLAASDVLRNRRRTLSAILGVLLAVTFVAGTFIAIDSSARATLDATLAGISGDFSFNYNTSDPNFNYTRLEASLLASAGVVDVSVYRSLPVSTFENMTGGSSSAPTSGAYVSTYGINPAHPPSLVRDMTVTGSVNGPRTVGLSREFADSIHVSLSDGVLAIVQYNETLRWTANLTVGAILDRSSASTGGYSPYCPVPYAGPSCFYGSIAVVNLRDVDWLLAQLNSTDRYGRYFSGEIWIDRAHYVNPYDLEATQRNLQILERRLNGILQPYGFLTDNILTRLQDFQNRIAGQRIQYLLLSMPVLLLGIYLGAVGVDLSHAERRRELAVLKTRGARRGQLVGLLLLEAVVGGLIAAVIGLVLGVGLSRLLLDVVNPYYAAPLPYEAFILSTNTVITVAILGMVLMASVAYRSAKRTASLPIIETLRYYAPGETKIHYSPKWDIALVTIGALDYIGVWLTQ